MRLEYLYQWTLKFKDITQELKYCQLREDMFRSNMLCVYVVWIFIVLCQAVIVPRCTTLVICLGVATFLLTAGCILVMAEEFTGSVNHIIIYLIRNNLFFLIFFSGLPAGLQKSSAALVHHRNRRTTFICAVIILMSAVSSIGLFVCPMATNDTEVDTKYGPVSSSILSELPYGIASASTIDEEIANSKKEYQLNVYVSATIHHNITINSPVKQTNDVGVKSINNFSSTTAGRNKNWQNLIPKDIAFIKHELYKSLLNETINGSDVNVTDSESGLKTIPIASLDGSIDLPEVKDLTDPCSHPEYLVFTWVLCLIALATGLKLYYLVKTFMAFIMVFCYGTLILAAFPYVFNNSCFDTVKQGMPLASQMVILLVIFLTMVTYHARLVEVTSRLDFIWKEQAEKELANMKSNRFLNDVLIKVCRFITIIWKSLEPNTFLICIEYSSRSCR